MEIAKVQRFPHSLRLDDYDQKEKQSKGPLQHRTPKTNAQADLEIGKDCRTHVSAHRRHDESALSADNSMHRSGTFCLK